MYSVRIKTSYRKYCSLQNDFRNKYSLINQKEAKQMPTRELTEEEKKEAREAGERVKMECEHSNASGECLEYNEICYFDLEDQNKCSKYSPKYK